MIRTFPLNWFDLFCLGKKNLVFNLVAKNLKTKYRRSIFGVFWTLLVPLAMAVVYYFVFQEILNVKLPHYVLFLISGMLPWAFFSQSVVEGVDSIVSNWGLVSKVPIPVQIFPLVGTMTNFVTLLLSLPVVLGALLLAGVPLEWRGLLIFPFMIAGLMLMTYSVSLILAVSFVFFRDLRHILGILMQIWFYATPVVYDESMIPEKFRFLLYLNPLGGFFSAIHDVVYRQFLPQPELLFTFATWVVGLLTLALLFEAKLCKGLVEKI